MKPRLQDISLQELLNIRQNIAKEKYFFSASLGGLSRKFLVFFIGFENIFSMSFEDIRRQFIESSDQEENEIPNEEEAFSKFVCSEYLDLKEAPRYQLLALHTKSIDQIKQIKDNIAYCNKEKRFLTKSKDDKKDGLWHEVNRILSSNYVHMLNYCIKINKNAQKEISDFVLSDAVYEAAHLRARNDLWGFNECAKWHSFDYDPNAFNIKNFSDIKNKFLTLGIKEKRDIEKLYSKSKENESSFYQFCEFMHSYIENENVPENILLLVDENCYLNRRGHILKPAIENYICGKKAIFLNAATIQIEGLFYDYCTALGISEARISKDSISGKLDKIANLEKGFYSFEYFKFRFSNIRNEIAHGKIMDEQLVDFFADFVLLDLVDLSGRLNWEDFPVNKVLTWIQNAYASNDLISLAAVAFFLADNKPNIPDFFPEAKKKLNELESCLREVTFFEYMLELTEFNNKMINGGLSKIMKYLENEEKFKEQRKEILRKIRGKCIPKKDLNLVNFADEVMRQQQFIDYY